MTRSEMKKITSALIGICLGLSLPMSPALAQDVRPGTHIVITSDLTAEHGGPSDPEIVSCSAASGLCLRDDNTAHEDSPITQTESGLQAVTRYSGVVYLFRPGGRGTLHNLTGRQIGEFIWLP